MDEYEVLYKDGNTAVIDCSVDMPEEGDVVVFDGQIVEITKVYSVHEDSTVEVEYEDLEEDYEE